VIWTACTTAFFPLARLGELLSYLDQFHDPTSDLTWADVKFTSETSVSLRLKNSKTGNIQGNLLDIFPFQGYNYCPIASLRALHAMQVQQGLDQPATSASVQVLLWKKSN
jgi:hypothetical protein